jgi:hypothetical protein
VNCTICIELVEKWSLTGPGNLPDMSNVRHMN